MIKRLGPVRVGAYDYLRIRDEQQVGVECGH